MSEFPQYTTINGIKCYSPDVASDYSDYPDSGFDLTDQNSERSFWVSSRNRLFKSLVQRYLASIGKTKFLEIGCGTGDFIKQISKSDNLEITGSEIYLKGLVYAKKNLPNVDFIQFDVTQGSLGEQFNMITAFDVIEHIEDDVLALFNINQMLKEDGVLILSVPQHMSLWSNLDEIVKHKRRYSRRELLDKLEANGFEIERVSSFIFILFPLMLISRLLDRDRDQSESDQQGLEKRVKFSSFVNATCDIFMRIDEWLIRLGVSLPFGGTLVVVARKRP
jgi:2-polyprenyl-3-methyl-5-hydroxy-6-metoxy-1,4-benzoquinol methylase